MNDYFNEYKYAKLVLLELLDEIENDNRYIFKKDIKVDSIDLTYEDYVRNILKINKEIISKEEYKEYLKEAKNENQKNLDYKRKYDEILLAFIKIIEKNYKITVSKEKIDALKKNGATLLPALFKKIKFTNQDITIDGKYMIYSIDSDESTAANKAWKILGFDKALYIPKSAFDLRKQEILDDINDFNNMERL